MGNEAVSAVGARFAAPTPHASCPAPVDATEAAEREHMGCAHCGTGIYAAPTPPDGDAERDRRDAERYRHVRAHGMPRLCPAGFYYHDGVFYPTADAAIDAYVAASKGEKA